MEALVFGIIAAFIIGWLWHSYLTKKIYGVAERGGVNSQLLLGMKYASGRGVVQNYTEAVKWFRMAAEQGNAEAQYYLGNMYANGYGVAQNFAEAAKWFCLAAEQGNANAQEALKSMRG